MPNVLLVNYHATDIVAWNDKEIILNNGSWYTNTTKKRMNQVSQKYNLGFYVFQKNGDWFCDYNGVEIAFKEDMLIIPITNLIGEALAYFLRMTDNVAVTTA